LTDQAGQLREMLAYEARHYGNALGARLCEVDECGIQSGKFPLLFGDARRESGNRRTLLDRLDQSTQTLCNSLASALCIGEELRTAIEPSVEMCGNSLRYVGERRRLKQFRPESTQHLRISDLGADGEPIRAGVPSIPPRS
jgi:hypothetical protein